MGKADVLLSTDVCAMDPKSFAAGFLRILANASLNFMDAPLLYDSEFEDFTSRLLLNVEFNLLFVILFSSSEKLWVDVEDGRKANSLSC